MKIGTLLQALPLALALLAGGAGAKTAPVAKVQILECNFVNGDANLIGDKLFLLRDLATNDIWVFDGVVKSVYKDPIKARVVQDNANRLEIQWVVENVQFTTSRVPVSFHATLLKAEMKIVEKSIAGAFENREHRDGSCAIRAK